MHFYKNGNYTVCMMEDGTKLRKTNEDSFIPDFSEGMDVCITHKCAIGCKFCYAGCKPNGNHGELLNWKFIDTLHPYTELAFNGNDLDHPQLEEFLLKLKEKKVYANMTVNQAQLMNNIDKINDYIQRKLIYGVGVSYNHYDEKFIEEFKKLKNGVLHVINGIIGVDDLDKLKGNNLKVLILGYKNIRRGEDYLTEHQNSIATNQTYLYKLLPKMIKEEWFKVISFDNLAIEQLDTKKLLKEDEWKEFYMGDDGDFTFYIDLVNGTFSKNSCCINDVYDIGDKSIDEMFEIIKNKK